MKNYDIILDIIKLKEGYYLATSSDVQGLVAQGKILEETIEIAEDVAKKIISSKRKNYRKTNKIIYPITVGV